MCDRKLKSHGPDLGSYQPQRGPGQGEGTGDGVGEHQQGSLSLHHLLTEEEKLINTSSSTGPLKVVVGLNS